jgi:hypothetical protein
MGPGARGRQQPGIAGSTSPGGLLHAGRAQAPAILASMRPSRSDILGAAALVLILTGLVIAIVVATIPAGGVPTLR